MTTPPTAPESRAARLAIVTVTYSPGRTIGDLLDSIPAATSRNPEIYISDNGSTDGAIEAALERHPHVRVLWNRENLGYGRAINRAVSQMSDDIDWVLIVNPDSRFAPSSIDTLLDAASSDASAGSAGPLIVSELDEPYPSARAVPTVGLGMFHGVLAGVWPRNPWSARYRGDDVLARGERTYAGWLSGACVLVRRDAFRQVGGFDDRYFMYFEDVDLGTSLGKAGWRNLYVPDAKVVHIGATTASRYRERTLRAHHESAYRYIAKTHPEWWWAPLRGVVRAGLGLRLKLALRRAKAERAKPTD